MKRAFDIFAVVATLPIWLPLIIGTALAVLIFEGRPIFFVQERCGLKARPFKLRKFRTMKPGAGPDAERLTRFGALLRSSSLDELPELFHVISGQMSLVGPRPLPSAYLSRYSHTQLRRHEVRPGITGWAQIHGRNDTSWEQRLARDVWYVDHRSFLLDLKILYLTLGVVFSARGVSKANSATMPEFKPAS